MSLVTFSVNGKSSRDFFIFRQARNPLIAMALNFAVSQWTTMFYALAGISLPAPLSYAPRYRFQKEYVQVSI